MPCKSGIWRLAELLRPDIEAPSLDIGVNVLVLLRSDIVDDANEAVGWFIEWMRLVRILECPVFGFVLDISVVSFSLGPSTQFVLKLLSIVDDFQR